MDTLENSLGTVLGVPASQSLAVATSAPALRSGPSDQGAPIANATLAGDRRPENYCHKCGGPNVPWAAPSPLWNKVMREPGGELWNEIICPTCFVVLAKERGVCDMFIVKHSESGLNVELPTHDSGGRVYDPSVGELGMWIDP